MLIDWFTVAAQLVNFLVLVYLLKRFLYAPILRHMNEREEQIRQRLQSASDQSAEAEKTIEHFRQRERELDEQKEQEMKQAREEAKQEKQELLEKARHEIEEKRRTWSESLEQEQQNFELTLKKGVSREILQITQRTLQDLADEALNSRLADRLVDRIKDLDQDARDKLAHVSESEEIVVRSTCELEASAKRKVTAAMHQAFNKDANVTYQTVLDLPLGIEISAGNVKISWGIDNYLDGLLSRMIDLIENQATGDRDRSFGQVEAQQTEQTCKDPAQGAKHA